MLLPPSDTPERALSEMTSCFSPAESKEVDLRVHPAACFAVRVTAPSLHRAGAIHGSGHVRLPK